MADAVLRLRITHLTPIEEPEHGWCDRCNLSSLLIWHVTIEANDRLLNDTITTLSICTDCGVERWT
jgi:hypothetical protein